MADEPTLAAYQPQSAQRETTYGPFGEKYDVEPANVGNPLGAIVGLRAGFPGLAARGMNELGKYVEAKRLMDLQAAKNALSETGDYSKTLGSMPKYLQDDFYRSLPWHERFLDSWMFWPTAATGVAASGAGAGWAAGKAADALLTDAQKTRDLESRYGLRKWLVNGPEPGIPTLPNEPY